VGLLVVLLLAVALFVIVLLPIGLLARMAGRRAPSQPEAIYESPAIVRKIWETGPPTGSQARVGMLVSVEPKEGDAFVAELEETMPRPQARRIRAGHVITVRYTRGDPTRVVVVKLG
jgi:hypothetical protein